MRKRERGSTTAPPSVAVIIMCYKQHPKNVKNRAREWFKDQKTKINSESDKMSSFFFYNLPLKKQEKKGIKMGALYSSV